MKLIQLESADDKIKREKNYTVQAFRPGDDVTKWVYYFWSKKSALQKARQLQRIAGFYFIECWANDGWQDFNLTWHRDPQTLAWLETDNTK